VILLLVAIKLSCTFKREKPAKMPLPCAWYYGVSR